MRLFLAAAALPALFLTRRRNALRYGAVCVAVVAVWLFTAGVARHQCPPRFIQSMLAFAAAAGFVLAGPFRLGAARPVRWAAAAALLVAAVLPAAEHLRDQSRFTAATSARLHAQIRALSPRPHQLYVIWGPCFPFEYLLPFESLSDLRAFRMFGLGCATNTPLMDAQLRQHDLPDLVTGLCGSADVLLIAQDHLLQPLETYIAEHRGVRVTARTAFKPPDALFTVYQLRAAPGAVDKLGIASRPRGTLSLTAARPHRP
jgi:hypothetical protein